MKIIRLPTLLLPWAIALALMAAPSQADVNQVYELAAALANASAPIEITTATTTQLIAAPTATEPGGGLAQILVSEYEVEADGTGNIQFVFGTGSNCGTGQQNVTGNYHLAAQARIGGGTGFGPIWIIPPGNALCAVTSAAVGMHGSLAYRVR